MTTARSGIPTLAVPSMDNASADRSESDFVARLQAGDDLAYEELVRTYAGRMMTVAQRMLASEHDCADAVQDGFISAFRAIDSFHGESKLGTWLQRIVINACLMKKRASSRRPCSSMEDLLPQFDETGHHCRPVRTWNSPLDQVQQAESRAAVRSAIDELPEPHRTVLLLRDIQELDTDETAEILGIAPGAVKVRLHRARQALRTLLEPVFADASVAREVASRKATLA